MIKVAPMDVNDGESDDNKTVMLDDNGQKANNNVIYSGVDGHLDQQSQSK